MCFGTGCGFVLLFWLGCAVCAVGLGFRPICHLSWLGLWGVRGCVRAPPVPRRSRLECAVWVFVWARVSAAPRPSWLGCRGVRAFVRVPRLRPAIPRGVACVCVCFSVSSALRFFPGLVVGGLVASSVRRVCFPSPSWGPRVAWGCAGVAGGGVCPPPPLCFLCFLFFEGGGWSCRVVGLWCPSLAVPVLGLVLTLPIPCLFWLRFCVFFFFRSALARRKMSSNYALWI